MNILIHFQNSKELLYKTYTGTTYTDLWKCPRDKNGHDAHVQTKCTHPKIYIFLISPLKHMLWVLIRRVGTCMKKWD